jgi:hypothetical protein
VDPKRLRLIREGRQAVVTGEGKRARLAANLPARPCARFMGVSFPTFYRLERGLAPSDETAVAYARLVRWLKAQAPEGDAA